MSETRNRIDFTVTRDGQEIKLAVVKPTYKQQEAAQIAQASAYAKLVAGGALLKEKLKDAIREQGLWSDEKEKKLQDINRRMDECEKQLPDENGRVRVRGLKASEMRKAAVDLRVARVERVQLLEGLTRLENQTAEGLSENARFDALVCACTVYADGKLEGKPFFKDLEDYKSRGGDKDAWAAAQKFAELWYDVREDFERSLPENRFLLKHGLCDKESLALTDRDGNRVDIDGKPVEAEESSDAEAETFEYEDDLGPVVTQPVQE